MNKNENNNKPILKLGQKNFHEAIDHFVKNHHVGYFEAILEYKEKYQLEESTIARMIKADKSLRRKVELEAKALNVLKRKKKKI